MPKSDLVRAWKNPELRASMDTSGIAARTNPLAEMGVDDQQLRRAGHAHKLTTAWFCTLNTVMARCCQ
jgi:hypothetical protein